MTIRIVERFDPHWCCGACGVEPVGRKQRKDADTRKMHNSESCFAWGVNYGERHVWIWWEPYIEHEGG